MTQTQLPKLLFLHGFLQNSKVFSEKSSGIRKLLKKANVQCDYMDGPVILKKEDLPFVMDEDKWEATVAADCNRAWFYHTDISKDLDVQAGLDAVVAQIKEHGPYDGIVGFSQGAALSTIVTNKITELVPDHPEFKVSLVISGYSFTEPSPAAADTLQITQKFQDAFTPRGDSHTKMLFIYGTADQAVPCERSKYLFDIYRNALAEADQVKAFEHPGGHMCPNKKDIIRPVVEELTAALEN
ncbi:putative serine hydrolase KNAG_0B04910 [Huiozyma naganishii CBS 8797]|uniref:Serine hydrolase domain-containing protein n=1 Tax=Huiozyma naganishii (strain ATCC MYA-139 / BCRC 22969 / CBS 8797 / KCTC 17520 / NBRC 10181 / NCYC 3082 / Yp74L-3) TaxID=1071383 RepID=J7R284_HUIN7|nr:hypothetical protein KNAG_0B04910 [Kazachstania naganishii CBS 8797]CCK68925.1 hypothetical protein KNAG_0B04910 [Kazachstania naganishii CBS 8797]